VTTGVFRCIFRGFNQAINGFADDGWATTVSDGMDDVSVLLNETASTKCVGGQDVSDRLLCNLGGGILCAKASMLLQVPYFSPFLIFSFFLHEAPTSMSRIASKNIICTLWLTNSGHAVQNVPPAMLIQFLREHRSEWADCDIDADAAAAFRSSTRNSNGCHSQLPLPLTHSGEQDEVNISPNRSKYLEYIIY
jgi:homeobox-leucine zipper protein